MDDGKSIRYKDLYALFEQILEKTMRLEQRDWSESPVKVWVNTFKVFLDEYMIEYKPLDYTTVKVVGTFLSPLKIWDLSFHGVVVSVDTWALLLSSPLLSAEVDNRSWHTRHDSLVVFHWAKQTPVHI